MMVAMSSAMSPRASGPRHLFVGSCLAALVSCFATSCADPGEARTAADDYVDGLLLAMREGSWREPQGASFMGPPLGWEHVGPLMRHAENTTPLRSFPVNRLSSDAPPPTCTEGVMALWLVETVRVDSRWGFPSAAPVLVADAPGQSDLHGHTRAVEAYRAWWSEHGDDESAARAIDPLDGTGLVWR